MVKSGGMWWSVIWSGKVWWGALGQLVEWYSEVLWSVT